MFFRVVLGVCLLIFEKTFCFGKSNLFFLLPVHGFFISLLHDTVPQQRHPFFVFLVVNLLRTRLQNSNWDQRKSG